MRCGGLKAEPKKIPAARAITIRSAPRRPDLASTLDLFTATRGFTRPSSAEYTGSESDDIGFVIAHQNQPDHDETNRPDPSETFARGHRFRKAKLQPARPAGDDSENGERCVAQLNEQLLLHVA